MVIETANPPNPLPLTVAAVAGKFISPPAVPVHRNGSGTRLEPLYDARPIGFSKNYGGMRGPKDPLHFTFQRWIKPTDEELKTEHMNQDLKRVQWKVMQYFTTINQDLLSRGSPYVEERGLSAQQPQSKTRPITFRCLTSSAQVFEYHSDEVFQPSNSGTQIGKIDERWNHLDVASVKLNPSVKLANSTYFEAKIPSRLLRSLEIPDGAFFSMDGMSTGVVYMQAQGLTLDIPPRHKSTTEITFSKILICRQFTATGAVPREGGYGAALLEDDTEKGGVAGFFQIGNEDFAFSPY
ncbi:MAG: hypothetical protein Q9163_003800 [Psora crenata]